MSLVWELSQINAEINRDDKFLLLALADHANDDGECYPSLSKIQKKCFFSKQGLLNSMDRVIKIGYVSKNKRKRENGSNTSNLYQLHEDRFSFKIEEAKLLEDMKKCINANTTQVVNGVDKGSLPDGLGVVNDIDKGSLHGGQLYEPSINHHYESSFNLSLERVDFKTSLFLSPKNEEEKNNFKTLKDLKKYYIKTFDNSGKIFEKEHVGGYIRLTIRGGYLHNLETNKDLTGDEAIEIWNKIYAVYLNQKSAS